MPQVRPIPCSKWDPHYAPSETHIMPQVRPTLCPRWDPYHAPSETHLACMPEAGRSLLRLMGPKYWPVPRYSCDMGGRLGQPWLTSGRCVGRIESVKICDMIQAKSCGIHTAHLLLSSVWIWSSRHRQKSAKGDCRSCLKAIAFRNDFDWPM